MSTPLRIVGQGLAGALLAWECERAGIDFRVFAPPSLPAASKVAAGIINPITGRRVVKSWRVDELLPIAVTTYRQLEEELGEQILFPTRVRRIYRDARERWIAEAKQVRGELTPYVREMDADGFWIESACYVNTRLLTDRLEERWVSVGKLHRDLSHEEGADPTTPTVWCIGAGELILRRFGFVPLRAAKGEILRIRSNRVPPGGILNDGHWCLPVGKGEARIGATFELDRSDVEPTPGACAVLTDAARRLLGADCEILRQEAGVRVVTPDKHPIAGRHPNVPRCGVINGLGSKGALLAPWLAQQWTKHLKTGAPFDRAIDVRRFAP